MGRAASSWVLGGGEVLDGLSKPASTATKQVEALPWLFRAQNSTEKLCA
jgi:hypothetical protein